MDGGGARIGPHVGHDGGEVSGAQQVQGRSQGTVFYRRRCLADKVRHVDVDTHPVSIGVTADGTGWEEGAVAGIE